MGFYRCDRVGGKCETRPGYSGRITCSTTCSPQNSEVTYVTGCGEHVVDACVMGGHERLHR